MKWHCVAPGSENKYCNGIPEWNKEPTQFKLADGTPAYMSGGTCKLTPETCERCRTSQELWEELSESEKERVSNPTYTQTVIPVKQDKTSATNPKGAKAKKSEKETAQGKLF
jgi:hypothetical protein